MDQKGLLDTGGRQSQETESYQNDHPKMFVPRQAPISGYSRESRVVKSNMLHPRRRKLIPHPSPEALAAQERRIREEWKLTDRRLGEFNEIKIINEQQRQPQSVREPGPAQDTAVVPQKTQAKTENLPKDIKKTSSRDSSAAASCVNARPKAQQNINQKPRQKHGNKSKRNFWPEKEHAAASSCIVLPTWRNPAASFENGVRPNKTIQSTPFNISKVTLPVNHVYTVKYRHEKGSSIGTAWQKKQKLTCFYEDVNLYTKTRYAPGDILTITFSDSPGGYARLVEIRGIERLFIVVQWLYSREDIACFGVKLPSVQIWSESEYVLSNHFQVLAVENIEDITELEALKEVYWDFSTTCLRSLDVLDQRLEKQLNSSL